MDKGSAMDSRRRKGVEETAKASQASQASSPSRTAPIHQTRLDKNRKGSWTWNHRFILINDIPAAAAMTPTTSQTDLFGATPTLLRWDTGQNRKKTMSSHVFADWYHIMITVLKSFRRARNFTVSA